MVVALGDVLQAAFQDFGDVQVRQDGRIGQNLHCREPTVALDYDPLALDWRLDDEEPVHRTEAVLND